MKQKVVKRNNRQPRSSFFSFNFDNVAYLNIFRVFCALSVILLHIDMFPGQTALWQGNFFLEFVRNGLAPIAFFFLISGFLFHKLYFDRLVNKEVTGKQYFKNKFIKFLPFTLLTTTIFYILSLIATYGLNMQIARGSTNLIDWLFGVFLGGKEIFTGQYSVLNAVLWYINILIFVYIVAFLFICLYRKKPSKAWFLIPMLLGLGMRFINNGYPFCNVLFGRGLFNFFLGFYLYQFCIQLTHLKKKGVIITKSISLFLVAFYLFSFFYLNKLQGEGTIFKEIDTDFGLANAFFFIPLILLCNGSIPNKIASFKPISFICSLTFDTFMWHQIVFAIIEIIIRSCNIQITNSGLLFFIIMISVLFVSILSNLFIDKQIRNKTKEIIDFI